MTLIRWKPRREWDPFGELTDLQREINRLFNLSSSRGYGYPTETAWTPVVDLYRENDHYLLKAELPGLTKEDISLTVEGNVVRLKGQKKREKEVKQEEYYCVERFYGNFERSFELPTEVDAGKVKATVKDGVLEVELPLSETAKPKQIEVKVK